LYLEASEDSSPCASITQCQDVSIYDERASRVLVEQVRVGGRLHVVFKDARKSGIDAPRLSDRERPDATDDGSDEGEPGWAKTCMERNPLTS
jgi:hypothetical protein